LQNPNHTCLGLRGLESQWLDRDDEVKGRGRELTVAHTETHVDW
jgi:hypothetical protein